MRLTGIDDTVAQALHFENVGYIYGEAAVVDGVDWVLAPGAIHCLLGRSGCGKSTLLQLAAGLLKPSQGNIRRDAQVLHAPRADTGLVFQSPTLMGWMSVLDNVLLPVTLQRRPDAGDVRRAHGLLAQLGLEGLQHRYPAQLSGGQQSRVALARALVLEPPVLLLDEPFAALDALTREALQDTLLALCASRPTTVLFVTHDISEAVYLADRVAVMAQGRLGAEVAVALPRPRPPGVRYSPLFNRLCAELRAKLDGGVA